MTLSAQSYLTWLLGLSLLVGLLEACFPRHPNQKRLRSGVVADLGWLLFHGEVFSVVLSMTLFSWLPFWESPLAESISGFSVLLQVLIVFVLKDLLEYSIHVLMHRLPWLWEYHALHHAATELDFLVHFRFHWMEAIVYRIGGWLLFLFLGFHAKAVFVAAILATLIGHLNHANLNWSYGVFGYIFNNPSFHILHHEKTATAEQVGNFAISLSVWDYLFQTARSSPSKPLRLGLPACVSGGKMSFMGRGIIVAATLYYLSQ